jgi:hypothetical protein
MGIHFVKFPSNNFFLDLLAANISLGIPKNLRFLSRSLIQPVFLKLKRKKETYVLH